MHSALALPELCIIFFSFFDRPTLYVACLVCRAWAATGLQLLWRQPNPHAFKSVSERSRQQLQGAIRQLHTPNNLEDMSGWSFPKITELRLDREIAKQADAVAHLLKHSGDDLRSVIFGHSNMASGCVLDGDVFLLLAYRPGLVCINIATEFLRKEVVERALDVTTTTTTKSTFASLRHIDAYMAFDIVQSLVLLLIHSPLHELTLTVTGRGNTAHTTKTIAAAFPQLKVLKLDSFQHCVVFSDIIPLKRLTRLTTLSLVSPQPSHSHSNMHLCEPVPDNSWRCFLENFPVLRSLTVRIASRFTPNAYRHAGLACRQLRTMCLNTTLRLWDETDMLAKRFRHPNESGAPDKASEALSQCHPAHHIVDLPELKELHLACLDRTIYRFHCGTTSYTVAGLLKQHEGFDAHEFAARLRIIAPSLLKLNFLLSPGKNFVLERQMMTEFGDISCA